MEEKTVKDATHNLICRHCYGRNYLEYYMPCIVLKTMQNQRLKILVFGDRMYNNTDDKKRIRYVDYYRVIPKVL